MTVSVLIPAYNALRFVPTALECVRAQNHTYWEVIVVEDGSNDGTEAAVRAFAASVTQRVRYDNLGRNQGVAAARNRLLSLAEGEVIAFLDADDLWTPDHLSSLLTTLESGVDLAFSGIELWDGDRHVSMGPYLPQPEWLKNPRRHLFERSFIQTSSCVALTRAARDRTGKMDEALRIGEDRDYWFRILKTNNHLACTGQVTCRYTKHAGSSMTATHRVAQDVVAFYRKHASVPDVPRRLRRRLLADSLWTHGRLLRRAEPTRARRLFREAVATWPLSVRFWPYLLA